MKEIILVKYGEIILKGLNRSKFEDMLIRNIKKAVPKGAIQSITKAQAIIYITPTSQDDIDEIIQHLSKVFGITYIARTCVLPKDMQIMQSEGAKYFKNSLSEFKTFKVESKRSDKKFPYKSPEISALIGGAILEGYPHLKVDVINPDVIIRVEVREKESYIYSSGERIMGCGGMPIGSNGKATLLLSGGIDSPVAGWMMAKRGVEIDAIHFFSAPYTSERAKEKVIELAKIIASYTGGYNLYIVPFTQQQLAIKANCPEEHLTLIMRRMMMMIAERIALKNKSCALITGESLGQVASQTIHALSVTNDAVETLPVFRPLIGMDKDEIVVIARKIGTFDTSILPYEDCCTVFVPKHPTTKPKLEKILESQSKLDMEMYVDKAVNETQWIRIEA